MYRTPVFRGSASRALFADIPSDGNRAAPHARAAVPLASSTAVLSSFTLLSSREHEIAALVATGLSNKEVALMLKISPWTVSAHLRRIFTKLDISRRMELCLMMAQR